ncbi:Fic family protein [Frigoribacterium sp. UYMn621]|uniref:Fic/DOC family protein n=1 Tax=Frigoribacterium sp. UYMn621 TaxID=3156343 RepID=UPI00339788C9
MAEFSFTDPYIDPETGILRNLIGARTQAELDDAEFDLVHAAEIVLRENPPTDTRDINEWRAIHRSLFGDIYAWAGELRTVDIAKSSAGVGFQFMGVSFFDNAIPFAENEIQRAFAKKFVTRDEFIARLAEQYSNLNVLHPFREGNGRTQRFFWSQVARTFGYSLDWRSITADQNAEASAVAAVSVDYQLLVGMFSQVVDRIGPASTPFSGVILGRPAGRQEHPLPAPQFGSCAVFMPRAKKPCVLTSGHRGHHRSVLRTS